MEFDSTFAAINAFGQVDYAPQNKGITPVFFVEPIVDEVASEQKGRKVYRDMERVRIYIAGDSLSAAAHPVDAGIKARFRDQYAAWKSKKSGDHIVGTPLFKWPMATPGLIRELESVNIFSVEDLAAVSDGNIQNVTDGRSIREKATAWLKSAQDHGAAMKYAAENHRLREEVAELRRMFEAAGLDRPKGERALPPEHRTKLAVTPPKKAKAKKGRRKSAWTPERRKAASEAMKARGGVGAPKIGIEEYPSRGINAGENYDAAPELGAQPAF